ncbi:hypothetical protein KIPE111705_46550 [Kibdelosporangium persicum]
MPPPPPRRKTGLIVAIVAGCLLLVGAAVALVILLSDDDSEDSSGSATASGSSSGKAPGSSATTKAVQAPPRACDLLSQAELTAILPGGVKEPFSAGPETVGEGMIGTRCSWTNVTSVNGQRFPSVMVQLNVTAAATEDVARTALRTSGVVCDAPRGAQAQLTGTDEACLEHSSIDVKTQSPVGNAAVVARRGTLVVTFRYSNTGMPIEGIDQIAKAGAASVMEKAAQSR